CPVPMSWRVDHLALRATYAGLDIARCNAARFNPARINCCAWRQGLVSVSVPSASSESSGSWRSPAILAISEHDVGMFVVARKHRDNFAMTASAVLCKVDADVVGLAVLRGLGTNDVGRCAPRRRIHALLQNIVRL